MAAVGKEAYVRPIKDLSVTAKRVTEQVCGRLVHHYTETFKKGSSKTVAVLVDGESLRSVLVLEAWSAADQAHMKQALLPHAGKVVCRPGWFVTTETPWDLTGFGWVGLVDLDGLTDSSLCLCRKRAMDMQAS